MYTVIASEIDSIPLDLNNWWLLLRPVWFTDQASDPHFTMLMPQTNWKSKIAKFADDT